MTLWYPTGLHLPIPTATTTERLTPEHCILEFGRSLVTTLRLRATQLVKMKWFFYSSKSFWLLSLFKLLLELPNFSRSIIHLNGQGRTCMCHLWSILVFFLSFFLFLGRDNELTRNWKKHWQTCLTLTFMVPSSLLLSKKDVATLIISTGQTMSTTLHLLLP